MKSRKGKLWKISPILFPARQLLLRLRTICPIWTRHPWVPSCTSRERAFSPPPCSMSSVGRLTSSWNEPISWAQTTRGWPGNKQTASRTWFSWAEVEAYWCEVSRCETGFSTSCHASLARTRASNYSSDCLPIRAANFHYAESASQTATRRRKFCSAKGSDQTPLRS